MKTTMLKATRMHVNPEAELPNVEKMLYDLAWKFTRKYPQLEFEEAKAQAYWGFMVSCRDFNPTAGMKFSSHCYRCVWIWLQNLVMERSRNREVPTEINEELLGEAPPAHSPCLEILEGLSSDAREIVRLLLEAPAEMALAAGTPKQLLKSVKAHLVRRGRCQDRIDAACVELRTNFRAVWAERATV